MSGRLWPIRVIAPKQFSIHYLVPELSCKSKEQYSNNKIYKKYCNLDLNLVAYLNNKWNLANNYQCPIILKFVTQIYTFCWGQWMGGSVAICLALNYHFWHLKIFFYYAKKFDMGPCLFPDYMFPQYTNPDLHVFLTICYESVSGLMNSPHP